MMFGIQTAIPGGSNPPLANSSPNLLNKMNENASTMPMPMFTFLEQYDLSGKTIVPFVTHGGGGVANCVSDLKKAVPGATVLDALVVSGGSAQNAHSDVSAWLKRLGLVK